MSKRLIIKDRVTDVIGVCVWILAGVLLWRKDIEFTSFLWMFGIGAAMFYVPDEWVTTHLKEWFKKKV